MKKALAGAAPSWARVSNSAQGGWCVGHAWPIRLPGPDDSSVPVKLRAATIGQQTIWCAQVAGISGFCCCSLVQSAETPCRLQFHRKSSESERVFIHTRRFRPRARS